MVKALLGDKRVDINQGRSDDGSTPLYFAAEYRQPAIAKLLLGHPEIDVNKSNRLNQNALHIACENKDSKMVKILLKHPNINVTAKATSISSSKEFDALYAAKSCKEVEGYIKKAIKHRCLTCNKNGILKCGRCKKAYYCSKDCQRKHWKMHKIKCKEHKSV